MEGPFRIKITELLNTAKYGITQIEFIFRQCLPLEYELTLHVFSARMDSGIKSYHEYVVKAHSSSLT